VSQVLSRKPGSRAPVRIVDRHLLAGAEEPGGERELACGRHTDLVLFPAEGGDRTAAGALRGQNPDVRVVRFRQAPAFNRESAEGLRRLFGGPFFPGFLARPEFLNLIPEIKGLRFQVVHSYDVGEVYWLALLHDVRGAFNLAAHPVLDAQEVGRVLKARPVPVPVQLARAGARLSW